MPLGASYQKTSIGEGEDRLPIHDLTGPTDMIKVQVRKENRVDVGWINAGFFEIVEECPPMYRDNRPLEVSRPIGRIDQQGLPGCLHHVSTKAANHLTVTVEAVLV